MIAGSQRVTYYKNYKINKREVISDKWQNNTVLATEAITLLNLIYFIYNITKSINQGSITVYTDNELIAKDYNRNFNKITKNAVEVAESTCKIKWLIKKLRIRISIEYR